MRLSRFVPILLVVAMFLVVGACAADPTPTATTRPTSTPTPTAMPSPTPAVSADVEQLVSGWYNGREVRYYDFGMNSPVDSGRVATAPIYVFVTGFDGEGNPQFVEGQHNVVDTVPGVESYSDLWRVMLVTVPDDYDPDSVRSAEEINEAGFEITATDMLVNCPIVASSTELEGGEPLVQGWYEGAAVYYPDFGLNSATTAPIWAFIHGFDGQGNPMFVEGQNNLVNVVPGDQGYSAFWEVNLVMVPEGYEPNSIKDVEGVVSSGYEVVQPGLMVNCPVVFVAES